MLGSRFRFVPQASAGLTGLALALSIAGQASAQAPAAPAEAAPAAAPANPEPASGTINVTGKPMIDLSTPPPPPPQVRTYQQHEGFYTRVDVGIGGLYANKSGGNLTASTGGMSFVYDVLIGAGPAPGITLGGAALGSIQLSGDWEQSDTNLTLGSGNVLSLVLGPFVDGFPDSKGGFHLGGSAGFAFAKFDVGDINDGVSALGVGGAFWSGWDVWVAPEWSMGFLLRVDALYAKDIDISVSTVGGNLMFSVLYN